MSGEARGELGRRLDFRMGSLWLLEKRGGDAGTICKRTVDDASGRDAADICCVLAWTGLLVCLTSGVSSGVDVCCDDIEE